MLQVGLILQKFDRFKEAASSAHSKSSQKQSWSTGKPSQEPGTVLVLSKLENSVLIPLAEWFLCEVLHVTAYHCNLLNARVSRVPETRM